MRCLTLHTEVTQFAIKNQFNQYYIYGATINKKIGVFLKVNTNGTVGAISGNGGTITCTGVKCAECDIEGGVTPDKWKCSCTTKNDNDGYCDMTKTISVGF